MAQTPNTLETCDAVRPQLALYAADQLDSSETKRVAEHVTQCIACTQEVAFTRVLSVSGPRIPLASPPEDLFEKIALATYAAPPRRTLRETLLSWVAPAPTRLALGTAFAVGVAALVVLPRLSDRDALTVPQVPSHPVASQTQHKALKVAPAQKTSPVALPMATAVSEKGIAKNTPKTVTPLGKSKETAAGVTSGAPLVTPTANLETTVATATSIGAKSQTAPQKITVKPIHIAAHKSTASASPTHVARPTEALPSPRTVVANNTRPNTADEETVGADDNGTAPDMERMTKVASADMSEMRMPTPATTGGASDEVAGTRAMKRFTLGGAGSGGRPSQTAISSRKASDLGIGNSNLQIVAAPAKID